jgi:uncharacterized protein (TIGR02271 family)
MTHTVVGLFTNRSDAQTAMQELVQAGFIQDNIDLSSRRLNQTDTNYTGADYTNTSTTTTSTTTADNEGIFDKIGNFFNSLFDDQTTASAYTNAAYDADAILTVHADSEERAHEAALILDRHGAMDVDQNSSQYGGTYGSETDLRQNYAGTTGSTATNYDTTNTASYDTANTTNYETTRDEANLRSETNLENEAVIPVVEENLEVGKRTVERGGARIRSRIVEKPVEANVRLREEHVVVDRRPVNREVTNADINNFQEGDIELTERAEVPVVNKEARVVEEVAVGKTVEEHDETVRDTIRRTDVDVQEIDTDVDDDLHTGTRTAKS